MFFSLILRKLTETCFLLMRQFINFYCVIIQIICWSITSRTPKNMESSSAKSLMLQLWIKYLRQSLVFMWNRAMGNIQFLFFKSFLLVSKKMPFWEEDWALCFTMKFWEFADISIEPQSEAVQELLRQLLYTMFITDHHILFHL